ncbi:WD-REPEATS-REGION domain-containing protein [Aphelenchoides bicaudatus]|nr:WD-REPEATS-REGION domain-containing protein [Aphelenchoides bicaudatus]
MNSVFTFRRSDEFAPNLDINGGTALDCSVNGNTLVISDQNDFIYLNTENGSSERKRRPVNKTVRMIRCHPRRQNVFAAVDRYNVEFWQGSSKVLSVAKTRITDFDFDHFDENRSIVATAESVTLVDSRSQSRLPLLFGATQAKFSPAAENFFYTAHVTDIRCFDVRNMKAPCRQFVSSGHERQILTMELHPTDSNVLVTSTTNEAKLWNCSTETIQPHILDYSNIKKFVFSQNGDVFAGLNFASSGKLETSVKLWQITSFGNAQELRHNVTDFIDLCWLKTTSQNQYLFTLSKKNNLFRHLVVPNIQTETVMMRAPISRNAEDEAIDQMALVSKKSVRGTHPNVPKPKSSNPLDSSEFRSNCVVESNAKSWSCWLRAPSIACEDLLFELNSVRKLNLLGLSCNEVNFQRAAIGLSYSHFGIYKKISVEIRFHRNFIENGFVFIELLKKDSPLNLQTAKMLLNQLSEEAWKQHRKESNLSVLARTLLQLQPITDSIHRHYSKGPSFFTVTFGF